MRVFVGFGYNDRDRWIEEQVFAILRAMEFTVTHGKDMHGETLQDEIKNRIDQSDAAIGFFTIRENQAQADFNSHLWVRDEMVYAVAKGKPAIPIKEEGAKLPDGLLGDRQYVLLRQSDRLGCIVELVSALERRNIRHLKLEPDTDQLMKEVHRLRRTQGFEIRYRVRDDL